MMVEHGGNKLHGAYAKTSSLRSGVSFLALYGVFILKRLNSMLEGWSTKEGS